MAPKPLKGQGRYKTSNLLHQFNVCTKHSTDMMIAIAVVPGGLLAAPSGSGLGGVLITRWTVSPSLMLCCFRVSASFIIFPAKIRHNCSGSALNFGDKTSFSYKQHNQPQLVCRNSKSSVVGDCVCNIYVITPWARFLAVPYLLSWYQHLLQSPLAASLLESLL